MFFVLSRFCLSSSRWVMLCLKLKVNDSPEGLLIFKLNYKTNTPHPSVLLQSLRPPKFSNVEKPSHLPGHITFFTVYTLETFASCLCFFSAISSQRLESVLYGLHTIYRYADISGRYELLADKLAFITAEL